MIGSRRGVPSRFGHFEAGGRAWRAVLALALGTTTLVLALGSCAKKITSVDPSYTMPEGRLTPDAQLVAWYEAQLPLVGFVDKGGPVGPDREDCCRERLQVDIADSAAGTTSLAVRPAGTIRTLIFDRKPATAFRPMRREANGGFRAILDHPLLPARKWLESRWEIYAYDDPTPSGFSPPTYVGRGIVSGTESADSPLTNTGIIAQDDFGDITYTGNCRPCDSLFTLRWSPVPGAARYWLHVYQLQGTSSDFDQLRSAFAAPINTIRARDFLVAYIDAGATSYRLGDTTRTDIVKLTERVWGWPLDSRPRKQQAYLVRIAAVDASGRLIAFTRGNYGRVDSGHYYFLYRLGAYIVFPHIDIPTEPTCEHCQPEPLEGLSASSGLGGIPQHR